jgi:molybdate transport system permease protein
MLIKMVDSSDIAAILLTFKLASITSIILVFLCIPLALWLAKTNSKFSILIETVLTLPLVLPPTVLGFYLLILMSPNGYLGVLWMRLFDKQLAFSFSALVIGSIFYSFPFVLNPIKNSFISIPRSLLESAQTLGSNNVKQFYKITLPLSKNGIITGFILGFAHTIGEFGVILMIGGSIPNETKVLSISIYDYVEMMDLTKAHFLSLVLILMSISILLVIKSINNKNL